MSDKPLKVLVVDDTVTYRHIVRQVLEGIPDVEVVGTAADGEIAISKIEQFAPDLLTLDLEMPRLDGLGVLKRLKQSASPVGAIMLSAFTTQGAQSTLAALELGAFDFVVKPSGTDAGANTDALRRQLTFKIREFRHRQQIRTILRPAGSAQPRGKSATVPSGDPKRRAGGNDATQRLRKIAKAIPGRIEVIALGISTGGPPALVQMLPRLSASLPVPILIVQHMPPLFTRSLADDLNGRCRLTVSEATDGQLVEPGQVLIAPGGKQMKVERTNGPTVVRVNDDPPELSCRPSVDYLFRSVARCYGSNALGVIMTGMGSDGTAGCRLFKQQGAAILVQDEASCVVFGMPRAPVEEGLADVIAPLDRIADEITRLAGRGVLNRS